MSKKNIKALLLFSGGLDSILAAKLLLEQNIEVKGVCFYSNFFNCDLARRSAEQIGLSLREIDISDNIITILKNPKHGYGSAMNPCIDCHALMLKRAGEIMKKERFDFVATGEVLNERPMSQNKRALKIVEKEAGIEGCLLRPLSAKLLGPTVAEISGLVDRDKLLDISGRSRQRQMELAKKFSIKKYPTPGGGCVLTQSGFAGRLKELMKYKPDFDSNDAGLVKIGRHFWFNDSQIILGRNKEENETLTKLAIKGDVIIEPENFMGPTSLTRGEKIDDKIIEKAKDLIVKYSPKAKGKNPEFKINK